jgi:hypothetical protein
MIRNEDAGAEGVQGSYEKQKRDCERKAAARLLEKQGAYYKTLKATVPGTIYMPITPPARRFPARALSSPVMTNRTRG